MTPSELIAACTATNTLTGKPAEHVCLVVVRDRPPSGTGVRLFGASGPTGRLACVKERDDGRFDVVGYFSAKAVLKVAKEALL